MKSAATLILTVVLMLPAAARAGEKPRSVTDSQGNRYQVDGSGAVYTDGSPAPVQGRPHASVENIDYYYNKITTLMGAGRTNDAIFMASELLDLPEANDNVRPLKYAVSLTLSRIFTEKELNTFVPFVRHESEKQVIYRNRPMDLEVRYPAWFESEDNVKGEPGKMEGAFIGLAVAQREGKVHPVTLAVSANVLRSTFDAFVEKMLSAYQERYGGALHPVVPSLRSGARQYEGTYTEDGVVYRYDTIYFQHPKADITYLVVFVCPDKRYAELKKHYVFLVKNMKIGKVPPLKYELKLPPDVRK